MKDQVESKIKKEEKPVSLMVSKSEKLVVIKTDQDVVKATEFLVQVKDKLDALETERQGYTKPLNESLRKLNARFKELTEPLRNAEKAVKEAIIDYRALKEKLRLEEEEKLRKQHKNPNLAITEVLPDIVESKSGETRTTKRWTFEVVDLKKVPRDYLTVDKTKVDEAISNGVRNIAGLNIFQKENISVFR